MPTKPSGYFLGRPKRFYGRPLRAITPQSLGTKYLVPSAGFSATVPAHID